MQNLPSCLAKLAVTLIMIIGFATARAQHNPFSAAPSAQNHSANQSFQPFQKDFSKRSARHLPSDFSTQIQMQALKKGVEERLQANPGAKLNSTSNPWEKLHKPSEGDFLFEMTEHNGKLYTASTTGRIYLSNDLGLSWTQIGHFPYYYFNYPSYFAPYNPTPHFLTVNDKMIFYKGDYSLDGGTTWGNIFDNSNNRFVNQKKSYSGFVIQGFLVIDNSIYVYTWRDGIYKTTDYGYTWTQQSNGLPHDKYYGFATDVQAMTVNNGTLYCKTYDGFYTWNGSAWQVASTIKLYHSNGSDAATIKDLSPLSVESSSGFYFTEGNGWNWTSMTDVDFSTVTWKPIRIVRVNDTEIFVAGSDLKLHFTSNKGVNWSDVGLRNSASPNYTLSLCNSNTKIFACNTYGLFRSDAPYQQWTLSNTGIEQRRFIGMAKFNGKLLALSTYAGLLESSDEGETWQLLQNELTDIDNYELRVLGDKLYVVSFANSKLSLSKSSDGGHHWNYISDFITDDGKKPYQLKLLSNSTSLFVLASYALGSKIFRSNDEGVNWTMAWSGYDSTNPLEIVSLGSDGKNLYASTYYDKLLMSTDNGDTWATASPSGLPNVVYNNITYYYPIVEFSNVNGVLYAVVGEFQNSLYKLSADGTTWSKVVVDPSLETINNKIGQVNYSIRPPQLINNSLLVYAERGYNTDYNSYFYSPFWPSRFEHLYYVSKDNGATWKQADVGTSNDHAEVRFLFPHHGKLYAGLNWVGGGFYRAPLSAFGIDPPVELYAQKSHGQKSTEVVVPVKANYFKNIISSQFSINWNPQVAAYVGVESFGLAGLDAGSFGTMQTNSGQLTFSWSESNLSAQTLADSSALFNIRFKLIGNYGAKTPVTINGKPLAVELINANFTSVEVNTWAGEITIDSVITIKGKAIYPNGQPIQSVTINLTGDVPQNALTDATGSYSFTPPAGINYSLSSTKVNDPYPLNGIDVQDVASIRRHLLGAQSLDGPYQIIAADVNESNTVSTLDIDYIQALILGINKNFPNDNQWTFTPGDNIFSDASNPFPYPRLVNLAQADGQFNQDFIAMKLGDVNNSRDNSQQNRLSEASELVFVIDGSKSETTVFEVPIQARNFKEISAYQFTVSWNVEKLEYLGVTNQSIRGNYGEKYIGEGKLTTLWDEESGKSKNLESEANLFTMQFSKKTEGASIADVNLTSALTPIAVYDKNLKNVAYRIEKKQEPGATFELYQNSPNSFENTTEISFTIPSQGDVGIEIRDITGRVVKSIRNAYDAGIHFVEWNGTDDNGNQVKAGLYLYTARYQNLTKTKKMIRN